MPDTIAIIGAGTMGHGIAHLCREAGHTVLLADRSPATATAVAGRLHRSLGPEGIEVVPVADAIHRATVVVDALPQDPAAKAALLDLALTTAAPDALLGTVTLGIPLATIDPAGHAAERLVGLHFMNPPHRLRFCELVTRPDTPDEVAASALAFLGSLGVAHAVVADAPGFVLNRVLLPFLFDAARVLERGHASAADIDLSFTTGCGHPMGPLAVLDLVGIATAVELGDVLAAETGDTARFGAPDLLRRLAATGGRLHSPTADR